MDACILTTGQVAKFCAVSTRTVAKWIADGHLKGYILPGSKHRRVQRKHLIAFMEKHGIPMDEVNNARYGVSDEQG